MRALIQRVSEARVEIGGRVTGSIGRGLLVFLGITSTDTEEHAGFLSRKVARLRIFNDSAGKMNEAVADISKEVLVVSQFTLYGDSRKGNRPSFLGAAHPDHAVPLYHKFLHLLAAEGLTVAAGEFGAMMDVHLVNHGPVTIWLDTDELTRPVRPVQPSDSA